MLPVLDENLRRDDGGAGDSGIQEAEAGTTAPDASAPADGNCSLPCTNAHGSASCVDGACLLSCSLGYADCDADPANGCEADITNTQDHCGGCATVCENSQGSTTCGAGLCLPTCAGSFGDCDANAQNGCETDLNTAQNCGACGRSCANDHGSTDCASGTCAPTCATGFADCDGLPENGCETNTQSDPTHCGGCGTSCDTNSQTCTSGTCQLSPCAAGLGECDGDLSVLCETDLGTSVTDCGFCGNACAIANGSPTCSAGTCAVQGCDSGYDNCDGAAQNGCETQLSTDVAHCGACNSPCTNPHGTTSCSGSTCAPQCATGYDDCDSTPQNGCETALDTASNCGMCGRTCPANGGTPVCNAGVCDTLCDLTGAYALKISASANWPAGTYTASGSGTFQFWMKFTATQSGTSLSGTLDACGNDVPSFRSSLISETYKFSYANTLFDHVPAYAPSASVVISLGSTSPGAGVTSNTSAMQLGVRMTNPVSDAWPSSPSSLTTVDDDADLKPGVTGSYASGGGYSYPLTGGSLFANRADKAYAASRLIFSLGGSLTSCGQASGSANVASMDVHILGCKRASSSQDCSGSEASFMDQNLPQYSFGSATYTLVRVADGASCADVRSALP